MSSVIGKGYDVRLANTMSEQYRCPMCNLLMRDPIQTIHGERACKECYNDAQGGGDQTGSSEIFKDRLAQREINQLDCLCNYKLCPWKGVVQDVEAHVERCLYKPTNCRLCLEEVSIKDLKLHEKDYCMFRIVVCEYCNSETTSQGIKRHEDYCLEKPIDCAFKCGENVMQGMFSHHATECKNILNGKCCPYSILGCEENVSSTKMLRKHIDEFAIKHCMMANSKVDSLTKATYVLVDDLKIIDARYQKLENSFIIVKKEKEILEKKADDSIKKYEEQQQTFLKYKEQTDKEIAKLQEATRFSDDITLEEAFAQMHEKYKVWEHKLNELTQMIENQSIEDDIATLKEFEGRLYSNTKQIDQIERNHAMMSATLSDLDLKLQLLENTCYNGHQIWRLDNIHLRMNNAITGKLTAIHSPPCFTQRGGYKYCVRLYLNGDGMGKATHLSLFFVIMKSEYDQLSAWPFPHRVTFKLRNPKDAKLNHQETFVPDKNSSSFQKPVKDMNIAAGCPMFIPLNRIHAQNFVMDDCLFFETTVGPN